MTNVNEAKETQIDEKDPKDLTPEITSNATTDLDSDEDDEFWDPLIGREDTTETHTAETDPKDLNTEITNSDVANPKSDKDGEYWDPLTDTYKNKKANNDDPGDEDFRECHIESEEGIETETLLGYETSDDEDSDSESRPGSDKDGEYWDPITDTYKNKKANKVDTDDVGFRECPVN